MARPPQVTASPTATASTRLSPGRAVKVWVAAAGSTSRANTSSEPVIWLVSAAATPSRTRNTTDERGHRDAAAGRDLGVDRREPQGPADGGEHRGRGDGEHGEHDDLRRS